MAMGSLVLTGGTRLLCTFVVLLDGKMDDLCSKLIRSFVQAGAAVYLHLQ